MLANSIVDHCIRTGRRFRGSTSNRSRARSTLAHLMWSKTGPNRTEPAVKWATQDMTSPVAAIQLAAGAFFSEKKAPAARWIAATGVIKSTCGPYDSRFGSVWFGPVLDHFR